MDKAIKSISLCINNIVIKYTRPAARTTTITIADVVLCLCHRKPDALCFRVCPSVSLCVCARRKPCEHRVSKTNEGHFTQFGYMCICFIDVLIRFWGQKVKGQGRKVTAGGGIAVDSARRVPSRCRPT